MRILSSLVLLGCLGASFLTAQAAPSATEVIASARARLGAETDLAAVKSLSFEAKLTDSDKKSTFIQRDYLAPCLRRETRIAPGATAEIVLASNGLEGFIKVTRFSDRQQQLSALSPVQMKEFSDLYESDTGFFAAPVRGSVTYVGEEFIKDLNKSSYALEYKYAGGLHVKRYFDKTTSVLLRQEIYRADTPVEKRAVMTDEGEIKVAGITFPKKTTLTVEGKTSELVYSLIQVNSDFVRINVDGKGKDEFDKNKLIVPKSAFDYPMP